LTRKTRPISWIAGARKAFQSFPEGAQSIFRAGLTIAAEGGKADIAKPMKGLGSGVFEIALRYHGDALRVVYAVQKKSTRGVKTQKRDIDLVEGRLKRLKEMLR
jgi:phage-related protein